jgi:hypothetical protein
MGRARHLADLVILNPTPAQRRHASDVESVSKNGVLYPNESIIP